MSQPNEPKMFVYITNIFNKMRTIRLKIVDASGTLLSAEGAADTTKTPVKRKRKNKAEKDAEAKAEEAKVEALAKSVANRERRKERWNTFKIRARSGLQTLRDTTKRWSLVFWRFSKKLGGMLVRTLGSGLAMSGKAFAAQFRRRRKIMALRRRIEVRQARENKIELARLQKRRVARMGLGTLSINREYEEMLRQRELSLQPKPRRRGVWSKIVGVLAFLGILTVAA